MTAAVWRTDGKRHTVDSGKLVLRCISLVHVRDDSGLAGVGMEMGEKWNDSGDTWDTEATGLVREGKRGKN